MNNISEPSGQIYRTDQLVGCGNLLGFAEILSENFARTPHPPLSLISLDVNAFKLLNETRGHSAGDAALRWIGLVLEEEAASPVYRIGGDEFVVLLQGESSASHAETGRRIFDRLNQEADAFGLQVPAASIAVLQYSGEEALLPADVLVQLSVTLYEVKTKYNRTLHLFQAASISPVGDLTSMRWVANLMVKRIVSLGAMLDESHRLAHTDPVTGLPNMRAAQQQLAAAMTRTSATKEPLTVLLIDGDDLKNYNKISYAAGDEMIQRLGATLNENLRPGDFLARWRVGDEFLVLLPNTTRSQGEAIGQRLCSAVQQASQSWPLPVTVSIGIAGFPQPGWPVTLIGSGLPAEASLLEAEKNLLIQAEAANTLAKTLGKNRVVIASGDR